MALGPNKQAEARAEIEQEHPSTKVVAAITLLQAGKISEDDFVAIVVHLLRVARAAIAVKVDAMLALIHDLQPVGFVPLDYAARDEASLRTVLGRVDDAQMSGRVQAFTANTLTQATNDFRVEIGKHHGATHWKWKIVGNTCTECRKKSGKIFPISTPFVDHPNSDCYPELMF